MASPRIPDAQFSPIKIQKFSVEAVDINQGLVAYQIIYEAWDVSGQIVETGEPDPSTPFVKCPNQKNSSATVIEWGVVDLVANKVMDVVLTQQPVREKALCLSKSKYLEKFKQYQSRLASMGLRLGAGVKLLKARDISPDLHFKSVLGPDLEPVFKSLSAEQRTNVFKDFCGYFENEKEIDGTTGNSAGLNYLQASNRFVYLKGFCPNMGALSPSTSYRLKGFVGQPDLYAGVIDATERRGATAGPDWQHYIEFTPVLGRADEPDRRERSTDCKTWYPGDQAFPAEPATWFYRVNGVVSSAYDVSEFALEIELNNFGTHQASFNALLGSGDNRPKITLSPRKFVAYPDKSPQMAIEFPKDQSNALLLPVHTFSNPDSSNENKISCNESSCRAAKRGDTLPPFLTSDYRNVIDVCKQATDPKLWQRIDATLRALGEKCDVKPDVSLVPSRLELVRACAQVENKILPGILKRQSKK